MGRQAKLNSFHMRMFAYFVEKLASTNDGDGSLLDSTAILVGAGMSDSNLHLHTNLPTLVVAGRHIDITGGRHLRYQEGKLANLQLTLLHKMGVREDHFGDSTGELAALTGV